MAVGLGCSQITHKARLLAMKDATSLDCMANVKYREKIEHESWQLEGRGLDRNRG